MVLVFISANSMESKKRWVRKELRHARKVGKNIIPVYLDGADSLKVHLTIRGRLYVERLPDHLDRYRNKLALSLDRYYLPTRYDEDLMVLGVGTLPAKNDIAAKKTEISEREQIRRRRAIAEQMRMEDRRSYFIENVFQITSPITGAKDRLLQVKLQNHNGQAPMNLLKLPLDIGSSYVAQLRLLTGMVTMLADNWPPLVSSYSALAGETAGTLDDFHYFVEFCWLSWGPSVDTSFMVSKSTSKFVVAQAALGDEANSLPLIVEKDVWKRVFGNLRCDRGLGWPLRLDGLYVVNPGKDDYFKEIRDDMMFRDLLTDGIALYFSKTSSAQSSCEPITPFYSTAYVWMMLEQIPPPEPGDEGKLLDCDVGQLAPGKALPFFEHANLASFVGLKFLKECLVRKAIHHLLQCDQLKTYKAKGYYRYATALFDDDTAEILSEEIARLSQDDQAVVAKRLVIPEKDKRRSSKEIVQFVSDLHDKVIDCMKKADARPA